jgi:hypothetical protein
MGIEKVSNFNYFSPLIGSLCVIRLNNEIEILFFFVCVNFESGGDGDDDDDVNNNTLIGMYV